MHIKPWMLVTAGVALTVASAVISQYFLEDLRESIATKQQEAMRQDKLVDETWLNNLALENRKNTAYLLAERGGETTGFIMECAERLSPENKKILQNAPDVKTLIEALDLQQKKSLQDINTFYENKISLENEAMQLEQKASRIANIAFLLQLMGLVLVASIDMVKRD